jgi:hypothetical protein
MKCPHGSALTGVLDVKRKSWQMGQLASSPFSLHLWDDRLMDMHALHVMQWK